MCVCVLDSIPHKGALSLSPAPLPLAMLALPPDGGALYTAQGSNNAFLSTVPDRKQRALMPSV